MRTKSKKSVAEGREKAIKRQIKREPVVREDRLRNRLSRCANPFSRIPFCYHLSSYSTSRLFFSLFIASFFSPFLPRDLHNNQVWKPLTSVSGGAGDSAMSASNQRSQIATSLMAPQVFSHSFTVIQITFRRVN